MESNRRKRDEGLTVVSNPEQILRDARRNAAASSAAALVGSPPIASQRSQAALGKAATAFLRVESKAGFHSLSNRPVSEECYPR